MNSDQPRITTVLPTFRRPALLRRAMKSVLEQEYTQLQLTVFDNASRDETGDVVAALSADDGRVRYHVHERNIGAAANFEFGLAAVRTPYFSILSDDDYLLPGFYREAIAELDRNPDAMFWAGVTLNVDDAGIIWDARVLRWSRDGMFQPPDGAFHMVGGLSPTWTGIVFRREVLDSIGSPDREALGPSDLDFVLKAAATHAFILRKKPVAVFSVNPSSFGATQPLASFWPGWRRMFENIARLPGLDDAPRQKLLALLRLDGRRMLFRRGANAVARRRLDFARDAAVALKMDYRDHARSSILSVLTFLCERIPVMQAAFASIYRWAERGIVASRVDLQRRFGAELRCD